MARRLLIFTSLAELVQRLPSKQKFIGSSPIRCKMIFVSLIILILITALPSFFNNLPENCYNRISAIVLLFCAILTFNTLNLESIGSGIAIYGGLFHITIISQFMDIILFLIAGLILIS